MKRRIAQLVLIIVLLNHYSLSGQGGTPGNVRTPFNFLGFQAFPGVPGPLNIRNDFNQQMLFSTTSFTRMIISNGAGNVNSGRVAFGNNLPLGFLVLDRLHSHITGGNVFDNYFRFTNSLTGNGFNDGFRIGNSSATPTNGPQGEARLEQFEQAPILMLAPNGHSAITLPYEWFRLQNGKTFQALPPISPIHSTDGYIGLNVQNPRSHIEIVTPAWPGGEEFFMAKPSDVNGPNVQMGMMNLNGGNGAFLPGVYGNINQANQFGPALQMLGCIHNGVDVPGNPAIMRFAVGRDWIINGNLPNLVSTNTVITRAIFSWMNADITKMYMAANGRLRIGHQLLLSNPANPAQRPNNRIEITADTFDPYFKPNASIVPNPNFGNVFLGGASGLRFTFLRSFDSVQVPTTSNGIDPSKVLTTDRNGDVVMINTVGNANNGLSVLNGTVQLGGPCSTPSLVVNARLLNTREIPLNSFNLIISDTVGAIGRVGIGKNFTTCAVGNQLEVNNGIAGPLSGLRLTDLANNPVALPNTLNKVLSVDTTGDVILVDGAIGYGNLCSDTINLNPLPAEFRIPTNLFQYKFYGQGVINNVIKQDIVSVGYSCSVNPPSRFSVLESQSVQPVPDPTYAGHFKNANISILGSPLNITGGVFGEARGLIPGPTANSPINVGGVFEGFGSWSNIGVLGRMNPLAVPSNFGLSRYNIGVAGISDLAINNIGLPPSPNYGLYAYAMNSPVFNFGVYTEVPASTGFAQSFGIYAVAPSNGVDFAGYFVGDVNRTGTDNFTNDQILKQNFDTIPNALAIINQLKPKTFNYKQTQYPQMNLPSGLQYGLVAQDVQTVMPVIVNSATHPQTTIGNTTYPAQTYSTVEYQQLIPVLIRAVQQLSAQNHKLDSLVTALTQTVSACCSNSAAKETGINGNDPKELAQINITLTDEDVIVLDQNKPNPFAEQTTITYNVPLKYGYAQLVFKTVDGRILKTVDINKKGRGQVNVFANDLTNGLYMYSLIVDGVTVDTKKMIKQN